MKCKVKNFIWIQKQVLILKFQFCAFRFKLYAYLNMPKFIYKAKKGPDEVLEGIIESDSERAAVNRLIKEGCFPVWLREEGVLYQENKGIVSFLSRNVKRKEIANITRQISDLLNSGLTLYNSLDVIERQAENPNLRIIIGSIKSHIKDGRAFSEALKTYPDIFSNLYVNLIKSGEAGSSLNEVLMNIADFLDKEEDTKSKIIAALAYPILTAIVGLGTIFILIAFVVPKLVNMFIEMGERLPLPTRMLMGLSDFMRTYWILFAVFTAGAIFLSKRGKSNTVTKNKLDELKLKIPIFGKLIRNTELARFSRTLSTLLKNGVPILRALQITAEIIDNSIMKKEIESVYNDVMAGSSLTLAIKKNTAFPVFLLNMAAIGEEGGFLDKTLLSVARSYETEIDRTIKIITTLLEPVFILIMGLVVGFVVISMLLPVFQISLTAH